MSETPKPIKFNPDVVKMLENFVQHHPSLKVTDEINARIGRIARDRITALWGDHEGRAYGDLEKKTEQALVATEALPEPERSEQIDYTLETYNKLVKMEKHQKWWVGGSLLVGAVIGFFLDGLAGVVFPG